MNYTIVAKPTLYRGVLFRSRLEAKWAACFDALRAGVSWQYEPIDLQGWVPDFWVRIPCSHSECGEWEERLDSWHPIRNGSHELYVEVKPYYDLACFHDHPVMQLDEWSTPSPAVFGATPVITAWSMSHGAGCGAYSMELFFGRDEMAFAWAEACNVTQWRGSSDPTILRAPKGSVRQ